METLTKLKIGFGGVFATIILILWAFGGFLGAVIGIANDDALNAVLSLVIPAYGAIYTVVMAIGALF
jgi:hypothetical protein